jgi:hypothetical protein
MEDEDDSVLGTEPPESSIEGVPILDLTADVRIADRRCARPGIDPVATLPICLPVDASDENPMQPSLEAIRVAQASQVSPREDERLLHGIVGKVPIAQHELGRVEQARDRARGQLRERVAIAAPSPLDQLSPQRLGPSISARWASVALQGWRADV